MNVFFKYESNVTKSAQEYDNAEAIICGPWVYHPQSEIVD